MLPPRSSRSVTQSVKHNEKMGSHGNFDERIRLCSYKNWPLESTPGILLAKEGLYFSDSDGKLICVFCRKYTDLGNDSTGVMRNPQDLRLHHNECCGQHDERNIPINNNTQGNSFQPNGTDKKYGTARFLGVRLEAIMALQEIYDKEDDDQRIVEAFKEILSKNDGELTYKDIVDILG